MTVLIQNYQTSIRRLNQRTTDGLNLSASNLLVIEVEKGRQNLALEEISSLAGVDNVRDIVSYGDGICLIHDFLNKDKLSFTKRIGKVIAIFDNFSDIHDVKLPTGKFYVRVKDIKNCHGTDTEPILGEMLEGKGRISFREPDFVILAYHLDRWYITEQIFSRDLAESNRRRAPLRPFFSPISMDPHFASFLINIGYFKNGSRILDPFCGGGGILIEAYIKGFRITGIDIMNEMVVGARTNLKYYGARDFEIIRGDFLKMSVETTFDGIVTDFPYGRNSHISGDSQNLYSSASEKMSELLNSGSRACVVTDNKNNLKEFEEKFVIDAVFPVRVHKSLTRYYTRLIRR